MDDRESAREEKVQNQSSVIVSKLFYLLCVLWWTLGAGSIEKCHLKSIFKVSNLKHVLEKFWLFKSIFWDDYWSVIEKQTLTRLLPLSLVLWCNINGKHFSTKMAIQSNCCPVSRSTFFLRNCRLTLITGEEMHNRGTAQCTAKSDILTPSERIIYAYQQPNNIFSAMLKLICHSCPGLEPAIKKPTSFKNPMFSKQKTTKKVQNKKLPMQ